MAGLREMAATVGDGAGGSGGGGNALTAPGGAARRAAVCRCRRRQYVRLGRGAVVGRGCDTPHTARKDQITHRLFARGKRG